MLTPVLIVDDDPNTRDSLALMLSRWGYAALTAADRDDAITILRRGTPALILLDIMMPGCAILPFLQACSAVNPKPKVVLISAYPAEFEQWREMVQACMAKPLEPKALKKLVQDVLAN